MIINDYHLGPQKVNPRDIGVLFCDIDGTIANLKHRLHWISTQPKNWDAFDAEMHKDEPIWDIINAVKVIEEYATTFMVSGRSDRNSLATEAWLRKYDIPYDGLIMRKDKDYRNDQIIKGEILDRMLDEGYAPDLILDDRDRVVKMWRDRGFRCIQVNFGDF